MTEFKARPFGSPKPTIQQPPMHEMQMKWDLGEDKMQTSQFITDEFLTDIADLRQESKNKPAGNMHLAARVPEDVHNRWLQQDCYDCTKEPIKETLKRLSAENLGAFIATNKRV